MDADLKLSVEQRTEGTDDPQYAIVSNFPDFDLPWGDKYINFSGYFGKFGPHMFAAAPDMLEALIDALALIELITPIEGDVVRKARKAIAKAEGTEP